MCGGRTVVMHGRRQGSEFFQGKVLNILERVLHLYEEERFWAVL
jgi:hypothetical protein